jgi:hypothetical protein
VKLPSFASSFSLSSASSWICGFVCGALLGSSSPAHAQWAVFDASNYANGLNEFAELQQMFTTASQTRDEVIAAYNLAFQMSRMPQNLAQRYQSTFSQWTNLSAPNRYGNTSAWVDALNLGGPSRAATAYGDAVISLESYPSGSLSSQDAATQAAIRNQYASSELGQATITSSLSTVGSIRSNSEVFAQKLAHLESDTYSGDSSQQTEMAVLGKINAATLLQIHSQQDTNQVLAAAVAEQALTDKQRIDEQNRLIDEAIYYQQNFSGNMQALNGGVSDSIKGISLSTSQW